MSSDAAPASSPTPATGHGTAWDLFLVFSKISAKAWGGGSGTTYTMHQELVRRGYSTSAQYALDLGLARLIPGINLLAVAVMVGYRCCGFLGSLASITGLLLPASLITLVLTAGFVEFTSHPLGTAVVKGVVPVTAALTYAMAVENASQSVPWQERRIVILMGVYSALAFTASAVFHLSVVFPIIGGAFYGALLLRPSERATAITAASSSGQAFSPGAGAGEDRS